MQDSKYSFKRGEVYVADLGENNFGSIQRGVRPVIILQNDIGNREAPTLIVVPLSSQLKRLWLPEHVIMPTSLGLDETSMTLCEQIATIDKGQIHSFVGELEPHAFKKVLKATLISLGFMPIEQEVAPDKEEPNEMILTLCQQHKQPFMNNPEYRVRRMNHFQDKEVCTLCDRMGYDYKITHFPVKSDGRNK